MLVLFIILGFSIILLAAICRGSLPTEEGGKKVEQQYDLSEDLSKILLTNQHVLIVADRVLGDIKSKIINRINYAEHNNFCFQISYTFTAHGICFDDTQDASYLLYFQDYNIRPITENYKKYGFAIAISNLVTQATREIKLSIPCIKSFYSEAAHESVNSKDFVHLHITFSVETNEFLEL